MYKVLVTDSIAESGLELLRQQQDVDLNYSPGLKGQELLDTIADADALITRSGTAVTPELLEAAKKLRVVGRAGVGLDNVDVDASTHRGVLVVNAPTANIMSATEHTMALMLAACRNIAEADQSVKRGEWNRSKFMGLELNGKTLGIIGLGRIGSGVARRAKAFGMRVIAYDPYIAKSVGEKLGVELGALEPLLRQADVITVHTPLTDETKGMIGPREFELIRDGVVIVNCARGGIYEENALAAALRSGKVAMAAIDVYIDEPPPKDHPLLNAPNIVLTPHIGANTIEAQDRVAVQTAEMVVEALRGSIFVSAVNLPFEGSADAGAAGMISLAEKLGGLVAQLLKSPVTRAEVELRGIDEKLSSILQVAALKGLLSPNLSQTVNFVNAQAIAQQRGIDVSTTTHPTAVDYTHLITFRASTEQEEVCVSGTLFGEKNHRVVSLNNFRVEFDPSGYLLYMTNKDVPGVVGKVGTILGDREVNIAEYNLARDANRGIAMAIVNVDSPIDPATLDFLRSFKEMQEVRLLKL